MLCNCWIYYFKYQKVFLWVNKRVLNKISFFQLTGLVQIIGNIQDIRVTTSIYFKYYTKSSNEKRWRAADSSRRLENECRSSEHAGIRALCVILPLYIFFQPLLCARCVGQELRVLCHFYIHYVACTQIADTLWYFWRLYFETNSKLSLIKDWEEYGELISINFILIYQNIREYKDSYEILTLTSFKKVISKASELDCFDLFFNFDLILFCIT